MVQLLDKQYQQTNQNWISELSKANHVSTTADCWAAHRRSFLGMTVHWLDKYEVARQSACLGVRRIFGSHTYDVLARAISDMHAVSRFPKEFPDQEICDDKEHMRCTCHTLNLIATTNLGQNSNRRFSQIKKSLYRVAEHFEKVKIGWAFCNKQRHQME